MEIEILIKKMRDINSALLDFIEATDDHDAEFKTLIGILEKQEIIENKDKVRLLFRLISKIADNHHRTSDFFDRLEKIFQYLIKDIPSPISHFIPDYTKYNKRILFLLLEKGFLKPDETFLNRYLQNKKEPVMSQIYYYLYPKMKKFLEEKQQKQIEDEISQKYSEPISTFEEKCQIGENDSYICSLIRSDSVEEFIAYVNRTNLSLSTKIKPSIYETHSFLIDKEPTLIEYASFFGSIQIFTYLKYNNVPLTFSMWLYAVHSNNAELIHSLEENEVKVEKYRKESLDDALLESIKCHHNDISNYIKDNLYDQIQTDDQIQKDDNFNGTVFDSLNFFFFPDEIGSIICQPRSEKGFNLSNLCFFLTTITIPSSVTSIGNYAFSYCKSLTQITIPSSVTSIEKSAFNGCLSLTQIIIPSSVTLIGNSAFFNCKSLTQITIPSSVISIENSAFYGCSSLAQIKIPSSVTKIGDNAFSGCSSLTQMAIPSSITSIGNNAFSGCSSLTQMTIPSSVTLIGNSAFSGCSSLTQITIPSSATSIGNNAFSYCSSLTQIIIPSSVTKIGNKAFSYCKSLTQITIPSSITSFGNHIFDGIKSLEIKGNIQRFQNDFFSGCSSLTQITIPSSVTSIGDSAFEGCSSLTQITIPSSVTKIGNNAFKVCSSLAQITFEIPSSVTSIGDYAFAGCSSLTQITIPSSVTSIGNNAFYGCSSLIQITIPYSFNGRQIGIRSKTKIIYDT